VGGGRLHDLVGGDLRRGPVGDEVLEDLLGEREVDQRPVEAGECGDPDQRALELTSRW